MLEPRSFFEVSYGQLDGCVLAVELVDLDGGAFDVGEESEVPPWGSPGRPDTDFYAAV